MGAPNSRTYSQVMRLNIGKSYLLIALLKPQQDEWETFGEKEELLSFLFL